MHKGRAPAAEVGISAVGSRDEMIAQETISRCEAGGCNCRLAVAVEGNVGSQSRSDKSEVLIGKVLKRHRAGWSRSRRAGVGDRGGEGKRVTHHHGASVRHA